jgi:hypothetical protein
MSDLFNQLNEVIGEGLLDSMNINKKEKPIDLDKLMQAIDKFVDNKNGNVWDEDITSLYVSLSANRDAAEKFIREQLYNQVGV